jgi:hypothetical protein
LAYVDRIAEEWRMDQGSRRITTDVAIIGAGLRGEIEHLGGVDKLREGDSPDAV